jgi:hypothetical protein
MNTMLIVMIVILSAALGIAIVACAALVVAIRKLAKQAGAYLQYAALREQERDQLAAMLTNVNGQRVH